MIPDSTIAISVKELSKKYRLFESPRDRIKEALHPFSRKYHQEYWALKNINFEILKGHTVGILGKNGSGKSTILQIITGIMKPTVGLVTVKGRISALLELGSGFNPEFTGRENAIFQAQMMGLSGKEINEKIHEIEQFADIGIFFNQRVKVYSSGMFVRLAFATSISIDPDILIIDEALSVGDAKFQNKCYQKIREFKDRGKTILLVTHSMEMVTKLCDEAILLDQGSVLQIGSTKDVTNSYFEILFGSTEKKEPSALIKKKSIVEANEAINGSIEKVVSDSDELLEFFLSNQSIKDNCIYRKSHNKNERRIQDGRGEIIDYLLGENNTLCDLVKINSGYELTIYMKILFLEAIDFPVYGFAIKTKDGTKIYGTNTLLDKANIKPVLKNEIVVYCYKVKLTLESGDYFISLAIGEKVGNGIVLIDHRTDILHIELFSNRDGENGIVNMGASGVIVKHELSKD